MSVAERIKEIIGKRKWSKNDLGMSRIQLSKLMIIKNNLVLLIKGDTINAPVWSKVENIQLVEDDIIIYFDGEYDMVLGKGDYEDYKDYVSKEEWQVLFETDTVKKLEEMKLIDDKGFYLEMHANIRKTENTGEIEKFEEVYKELMMK
jgi:hypothetical protein